MMFLFGSSMLGFRRSLSRLDARTAKGIKMAKRGPSGICAPAASVVEIVQPKDFKTMRHLAKISLAAMASIASFSSAIGQTSYNYGAPQPPPSYYNYGAPPALPAAPLPYPGWTWEGRSVSEQDRAQYDWSGTRGRMGLGASPMHPEGPGNFSTPHF
jgi:hypothetical protein